MTGRSASRDWSACARWAGVQASIGPDTIATSASSSCASASASSGALTGRHSKPAPSIQRATACWSHGIGLDDEHVMGGEGTHGTRSGNRRDGAPAAMTFAAAPRGAARTGPAVRRCRRRTPGRGSPGVTATPGVALACTVAMPSARARIAASSEVRSDAPARTASARTETSGAPPGPSSRHGASASSTKPL